MHLRTTISNSTAWQNVSSSDCHATVIPIFTSSLFVIGVMAFVGNLLVILTFIKSASLRTSTNYYIVSMAISDVLVEVFILTVYASEVEMIPINLRLCQVGNYIRGVSQSVSISSLVLITLDRYMAIVYPLKTVFRTLKARAIPLFLSWLLPIGFCLPLALKTQIIVDGNETFCSLAMSKIQDSRVFLGGGFVFLFILPLTAIIVLYSLSMRNLRQRSELSDLKSKQARAVCREKNQRILKMVVIIVIAFVICWGLFFIVKLIPSMATQKSCHILRWLSSHIFPSFSAALNPIILFVFSTNFKLALKSLIPRIFSAFCRCVCKVGPMKQSKQSPRIDTTQQVISEHTDTKL